MTNNKLEKLIKKLEEIKPDYGSITVEFYFHQRDLTKIKILDKTELVLFEKEKKNG